MHRYIWACFEMHKWFVRISRIHVYPQDRSYKLMLVMGCDAYLSLILLFSYYCHYILNSIVSLVKCHALWMVVNQVWKDIVKGTFQGRESNYLICEVSETKTVRLCIGYKGRQWRLSHFRPSWPTALGNSEEFARSSRVF